MPYHPRRRVPVRVTDAEAAALRDRAAAENLTLVDLVRGAVVGGAHAALRLPVAPGGDRTRQIDVPLTVGERDRLAWAAQVAHTSISDVIRRSLFVPQ